MRTFGPTIHWGRSRYQFAVENLVGPHVLSVGNIGDQGAWRALLKAASAHQIEVWGLDYDLEAAITLQQPQFAHQVVGDVQRLHFGEDSFSAVWMGQITEHLYTPLTTLQLVYEALVPGGVLVLDTPNVYELGRMMRWIFRGEDSMLGDPTHVIFYSFTSIYVLLENAGFQSIQLTSDGKITLGFASTVIRLQTVPRALHFLERFGSHILAVARKPGASAPTHPIARLVCPITRQPLVRENEKLYVAGSNISYPIRNGIPCLRPIDADKQTRQPV